ncbi:DUF3164 family protein [Novosphingobium sp. FSW06-99]|uniref:DUF3164 family protein n=1 Tax=Novosphingobium sp. FSW06-99 TaxID=1739113 RepID=UPI00076C870C|nr:DUF3164 family protein [Novosphingobium sp. FSW06-99]KUR80771.1 hypothetical protein AQZ49_01720 [Novosphingobium sp. FSW06-99]
MTQPQHPGAVVISGSTYLRNARGDLVPIANIKASDLLQDEFVRKMCAYAEDLSAELGRFQSHCYADIADFDALLDQEYGVRNERSTKGNRSFSTIDGSLQVKVCVADQIAFGPELQSAKKLLDELILERAEGADTLLVALVTQAFKTDKEGKVDTGSILALRRLEVDDPRWADIVRAIDDSVKVFGSKSYLRFYRRGGDGRMTMIPLDMASVSPSPTAFARQSLRRRVDELEAALADARRMIDILNQGVSAELFELDKVC